VKFERHGLRLSSESLERRKNAKKKGLQDQIYMRGEGLDLEENVG